MLILQVSKDKGIPTVTSQQFQDLKRRIDELREEVENA